MNCNIKYFPELYHLICNENTGKHASAKDHQQMLQDEEKSFVTNRTDVIRLIVIGRQTTSTCELISRFEVQTI